jgi:hypothetical protein
MQIANEAWAVSYGGRTHPDYAVKVLKTILVLNHKKREIFDASISAGVIKAHRILVHEARKLCRAVAQRRECVVS